MPPGASAPYVPHFKFALPAHYLPLYFGCLIAALFALGVVFWWRIQRRRAARSTTPPDCCLSILLTGLLLLLAEGCFYRFVNLSDSFGTSNMGRLWFWRNVHENNWGHRDNVDYTFQLAPGKSRIVFLGDSFTFGHGVRDVEDRFANRIRKRLEQAAPGRYEVQALSFPGWSTRREKEFLSKLRGQGFRADLVVLVYVPNDHIYLKGLVEQDKENRNAMERLQPQAFLLRKSYLANFLYFRFAIIRRPEAKNYYEWAKNGFEPPYWERHQQDLRSLPFYSEKLGARFAVVTFPFLHSLGQDGGFADIHRKLDAFWKGQKVPHLNLVEAFSTYKPKELMVNRFDAHPNVLAHRLAAEEIYRRLLVPELDLPAEVSATR